MKVLVPWLVDVKKLELREQEIALQPDKVLVRHVCSAPSIGTALHLYRGEHLEVDYVRERRPFPYPWLQGFAYGVGRVEEVGAQAKGVKEGDLVYCMKLMSWASVVTPADITPIPEGLEPEAASLAFQAGVALHGVRGADITLGDTVLVTGQGPIGVFAAQFCKLSGARRVIATDLYDEKLAVSRQVEVDVTLNARSENVPERVKELTGGRGADVVVEVSGSPKALMEAARAAGRFGRIAVIGWIMEPLTINLAEDFTPKGLELVVCHAGRGGHWRQNQRLRGGVSMSQLQEEDRLFIFDLMKEGKLKAKELITHRFPLKDIIKAWDFIENEQSEYLQVLFVS